LVGEITLPYPHFSAKTVRGKPLHVWTLEGRLDEIKIPTHTSHVYVCIHLNTRTLRGSELLAETLKKIDSFPTVTDERKALGRDFRRTGVRAAWNTLLKNRKEEYFTLATFRTISSSGTYMRSLAEELAKRVGTCGLAFGIHRTKMGTYRKLFGRVGLWTKQF
ncbi:hypothetical protein KC727_03540, partial [Candidatus Kaiserbacteria bacterium]|nr:hypothetical protein [Candidatus Kaiserbacteria bacterium]